MLSNFFTIFSRVWDTGRPRSEACALVPEIGFSAIFAWDVYRGETAIEDPPNNQ
jgi:hypothetical protein